MSVSQVWLSSLLSHLLKCMIEGASVEPISEIVQVFSLPSISQEKGWEGLSSMKPGFDNFESEFWLGSSLSQSYGQFLILKFSHYAQWGGLCDYKVLYKKQSLVFFSPSVVVFWGLVVDLFRFIFNGEISLLFKRSQEKQWKMSYLNDCAYAHSSHTSAYMVREVNWLFCCR